MNRHVIVTSSAGGIGRAVVRLFRERGAYVTGIDLKDADISCDLSHSQSRQEFIAQIESMAPRVDAVVAAAGILSGFPSKVISIYFSVQYSSCKDCVHCWRKEMRRARWVRRNAVTVFGSNLPVIDERRLTLILNLIKRQSRGATS